MMPGHLVRRVAVRRRGVVDDGGASTRGAITGRPLRSFSSAPQAARGHDRRLARRWRAPRRAASGRGPASRRSPSGRAPGRGRGSGAARSEPNHAASDIHGAFALPLVARSASRRASTGCQAPKRPRQVRAADLEPRVAGAAPVHAGQREPAPDADRLQRRPARRGGRVGAPARSRDAAFSGTAITRTEPAAPAAAGATRSDEHGRRQGGQGVGAKRRHRCPVRSQGR